ncbi:hypothetical protein DY000_02008911 [Brassica cretica]|uniref:Uncharacterized protein n=1 Tax=Brassica cretica TaxID=69181 RepID=A0ABQ7BUE3_BRACR|nr:hypothetical protein DY000_02008911 [Brassica cretica]
MRFFLITLLHQPPSPYNLRSTISNLPANVKPSLALLQLRLLSLDSRLKLTLLHTRVTSGSSNIGDGLAIAEPQLSPEIKSPEIQVRASPDHGVTIGSSNISCFALKASRSC